MRLDWCSHSITVEACAPFCTKISKIQGNEQRQQHGYHGYIIVRKVNLETVQFVTRDSSFKVATKHSMTHELYINNYGINCSCEVYIYIWLLIKRSGLGTVHMSLDKLLGIPPSLHYQTLSKQEGLFSRRLTARLPKLLGRVPKLTSLNRFGGSAGGE